MACLGWVVTTVSLPTGPCFWLLACLLALLSLEGRDLPNIAAVHDELEVSAVVGDGRGVGVPFRLEGPARGVGEPEVVHDDLREGQRLLAVLHG